MSKISRLARYAAAGLVIAGLAWAAAWISASAWADGTDNPGLWQVTGPNGSLYVMGSVHVLTEADSWMTRPVKNAFDKSQCLALEIDLASISPDMISAKLRAVGQYDPKSGGLQTHVSDQTYQRFVAATQHLALSAASLGQFRPWLIGIILTSVITETLGYDDQYGVDHSLMMQAKAAGKPIVGLESLDDQIGVLSASHGESDDKILTEVLDGLDHQPELVKTLAEAWRHGDMATIAKKIDEEFADEPMDYDWLIGQRNHHWIPRLEKMLKTGRHCMIVVGAGHLVGKDSLLTLLKTAGYTVTRE